MLVVNKTEAYGVMLEEIKVGECFLYDGYLRIRILNDGYVYHVTGMYVPGRG